MVYMLHYIITEKQTGDTGSENIELECFLDLVILATHVCEIHCTKGHLNFCL